MDAFGTEIGYELSILQFALDPTSGEWVNVGVVGYSSDTAQLAYRITTRISRLRTLYPELRGSAFKSLMAAIERAMHDVAADYSSTHQRPLARPATSLALLLPRIVSPTEPSFSWTPMQYGTTQNLQTAVEAAFDDYIGRHEPRARRERLDAGGVWRRAMEDADFRNAVGRTKRDYTVRAEGRLLFHTFQCAWETDTINVTDTISLDYARPEQILDRATAVKGKLDALRRDVDFRVVLLVNDLEDVAIERHHREGVAILRDTEAVDGVVSLSKRHELIHRINRDVPSPQVSIPAAAD